MVVSLLVHHTSSSQQHGISAGDIKKLKEGGVITMERLAYMSKRSLVEIKGISEVKVEKMQAIGARCGVRSCAEEAWLGSAAARAQAELCKL